MLYLSESNKADHRTYDSHHSGGHIPIEITTLDFAIAELEIARIDVLKIDTQGFECFVARHPADLYLERSAEAAVATGSG